MIHPVAACATTAVSVEEGVDKIRLGKAEFVVAGGFDDLGTEGIIGFADMSATADTGAMLAKGIDERRVSRANDRRRGGFVESQGGGTLLLARGDVAARMGLPVLGVVAYASSFADGVHTSIPAPGTRRAGGRPWRTRVGPGPLARRARPERRRHRRRQQARHVDGRQRPERVRAARAARGGDRPQRRQPAVRRLAEVAHRSLQGRSRGLPARRPVPGAGRPARCRRTAASTASTTCSPSTSTSCGCASRWPPVR